MRHQEFGRGESHHDSRNSRRSRSRDRDRDRDRRDDYRDRRDSDFRRDDDRDRRGRREFREETGRGYHNEGDRHGHYDNNRQNNYDADRTSDTTPPSATVMIKGLPAHTTEPTETGECKGFAFVEFYSVEYAAYFMKSFAGSAGDMHAPQFIVENRAVTLEYAKDIVKGSTHDGHLSSGGRGGQGASGGGIIKCDWLCESCGCQNFAKRFECYRCSAPKTLNSVNVTSSSSSDPYCDAAILSATPSPCIVVRGLPLLASEDQVLELFRQFASVKHAQIIRDVTSGMSRGIAVVEFHSIEHATHTINNSTHLQLEKNSLKINYAKDTLLLHLRTINTAMYANMSYGVVAGGNTASSIPANQYALAALQAAQWSAASVPVTSSGSGPVTQGGNSSYVNSVTTTSLASMMVSAKTAKSNWPHNFDTHGAAYHFQPQTGCFYDPTSQYFYCPKSRLYYHELDGVYLRSTPTVEPPYTKFIPTPPLGSATDGDSTVVSDVLDSSNIDPSNSSRKPVVMSLGFGNLASKSKKANTVVINNNPTSSAKEASVEIPAVVSVNPTIGLAKVSQNIAKWAERKAEISIEDENKLTSASKTSVSIAVAGLGDSSELGVSSFTKRAVEEKKLSSAESKGKDTKEAFSTSSSSGPAVCLLCRRQFPSQEVLLRHEKESKLHKENLLKAAATSVSNNILAASTVTYRDRASERRDLHGQTDEVEDMNPRRRGVRSRSRSRSRGRKGRIAGDHGGHQVPTTDTTNVADDPSNPGSQLLRRMGWKEGEGLGRDGTGAVSSIAEESVRNAIVGKSKVGIGSTEEAIPPIEYGNPSAYKESLLRAAKARYDFADKKS